MANNTREHKKEQTKVALIVGASGLIGQQLLVKLLASATYSKVIALVRSPLTIENPKLEQWQVSFEQLETELASRQYVDNSMKNKAGNNNFPTKIDDIFCTLGSTIKKAGSKAAFTEIDYHYPLIIAKYFYNLDASLFAIVTAMSANESSLLFYNQTKGKVESSLSVIGYQHLGIFRPSMLSGERAEYRLGEHIGTIVMNTFAFMIPKKYRVIQAKKVACAMLAYAENPEIGIRIIQSDQLQNY
ncbi:MAG: hypothetical protein WBC60_18630 [Cognaticolwellia sp.]